MSGNAVQGIKGGAVNAVGATVSITDCSFSYNVAEDGGAVAAVNSAVTAQSSRFTHNYGKDDGGALFVNLGPGSTVADCTFVGNAVGTGDDLDSATGGAVYSSSTRLTVRDSEFLWNRALMGGALMLADSQVPVVLERVAVEHNEALVAGGGVMVAGAASFVMRDGTVAGNAVRLPADVGNFDALGGAGLFADISTASVERTTFSENECVDGAGDTCAGSSLASEFSTLTVAASSFTANVGEVSLYLGEGTEATFEATSVENETTTRIANLVSADVSFVDCLFQDPTGVSLHGINSLTYPDVFDMSDYASVNVSGYGAGAEATLITLVDVLDNWSYNPPSLFSARTSLSDSSERVLRLHACTVAGYHLTGGDGVFDLANANRDGLYRLELVASTFSDIDSDSGLVYDGQDDKHSFLFQGSTFERITSAVTTVLDLTAQPQVEVFNCTFSANRGTTGAVVRAEDSRAVFRECVFDGNSGGEFAVVVTSARSESAILGSTFRNHDMTALLVEDTRVPFMLASNVFRDNSAPSGAGAVLRDLPEPITVVGNTFRDNVAGATGGGLHVDTCSLVFGGNTFANNEARRGGGMYVTGLSTLVAAPDTSPSVFSSNTALEWGGGAALHTSLRMVGAFDGNDAVLGGGLYVHAATTATVENSTFAGNSAEQHGGGVYAASATITVRTSLFDGNSAGDGGGLYVACDITSRFLETCTASSVVLAGVEMRANHATSRGGGAYVAHAQLTVQGGTFAQNSATGGGAFYLSRIVATLTRAATTSSSTIETSVFVENSARTGGGCVAESASLLITGNQFERNRAVSGGGLYVTSQKTVVAGNDFTGNTAEVVGSGIYFCTATCEDPATEAQVRAAAKNNVFKDNLISGVLQPLGVTGEPVGLQWVISPGASTPSGSILGDDIEGLVIRIRDLFDQPASLEGGVTITLVNNTGGVVLLTGTAKVDGTSGTIHFPDLVLTLKDRSQAATYLNRPYLLHAVAERSTALMLRHVVVLRGCDGGTQDSSPAASSDLICTRCMPGTYRPDPLVDPTITTCTPCPLGTYGHLQEMTECLPCAPGEFRASTGGTQCRQCPPGSFSPDPRAASCTPCSRGTYQDESGQDQCLPCEPGSFNSATGRVACTPCPFGRYADGEGFEQCVPCEKGTYQDLEGQSTCLPCPPGFYNEEAGKSSCIQCGADTFTPSPTTPCQACDTRVSQCSVDTVVALPGYWKYDNETFAACPPRFCELGGNQCADFRTGERCGECEEDYYLIRGECRYCKKWNYWLWAATAIAALLFTIYLVFIQKATGARMKIITFFAQTLSLLFKDDVRTKPVTPEVVTETWSIANFNLNFLPNTCLGPLDYYSRFQQELLTPLVLAACFLIVYGVERLLQSRCLDGLAVGTGVVARGMQWLRATRAEMKARYTKGVIAAFLFIYTPMMTTILSALDCKPAYPGATQSFLTADLSVECVDADGNTNAEYRPYLVFAFCALFVYVLAFPIVLVAITLWVRNRKNMEDPLVKAQYGVLYLPYDDVVRDWFESFMQLRKTIVVLLITFVTDGDLRRLLLFCLFCTLLILQAAVLPYLDTMDDILECFLLLLLVSYSAIISSAWIQIRGITDVEIYAATIPPTTLPWALFLTLLAFLAIRLQLARKERKRELEEYERRMGIKIRKDESSAFAGRSTNPRAKHKRHYEVDSDDAEGVVMESGINPRLFDSRKNRYFTAASYVDDVLEGFEYSEKSSDELFGDDYEFLKWQERKLAHRPDEVGAEEALDEYLEYKQSKREGQAMPSTSVTDVIARGEQFDTREYQLEAARLGHHPWPDRKRSKQEKVKILLNRRTYQSDTPLVYSSTTRTAVCIAAFVFLLACSVPLYFAVSAAWVPMACLGVVAVGFLAFVGSDRFVLDNRNDGLVRETYFFFCFVNRVCIPFHAIKAVVIDEWEEERAAVDPDTKLGHLVVVRKHEIFLLLDDGSEIPLGKLQPRCTCTNLHEDGRLLAADMNDWLVDYKLARRELGSAVTSSDAASSATARSSNEGNEGSEGAGVSSS